jgi:hypothetical protein
MAASDVNNPLKFNYNGLKFALYLSLQLCMTAIIIYNNKYLAIYLAIYLACRRGAVAHHVVGK